MSATAFNQKTIDEFHAKNGLGVGMFGNLLLLMTAVGARSGEPITTPLVHRRDGDHYIVIASKGGGAEPSALVCQRECKSGSRGRGREGRWHGEVQSPGSRHHRRTGTRP